jgi:hypothetical protein
MKASLTNEAVTTNEGAKTQIADQFLTGFRSRDWALWRSIMLPGIWLTGIECHAQSPRIRFVDVSEKAALQILLRMREMNFIPKREKQFRLLNNSLP